MAYLYLSSHNVSIQAHLTFFKMTNNKFSNSMCWRWLIVASCSLDCLIITNVADSTPTSQYVVEISVEIGIDSVVPAGVISLHNLNKDPAGLTSTGWSIFGIGQGIGDCVLAYLNKSWYSQIRHLFFRNILQAINFSLIIIISTIKDLTSAEY